MSGERSEAAEALERLGELVEILRDADEIVMDGESVADLADDLALVVSWDGVMTLLDMHYPADVWGTREDADDMDPGHRAIAMCRRLDAARTAMELDAARLRSLAALFDSHLNRDHTYKGSEVASMLRGEG